MTPVRQKPLARLAWLALALAAAAAAACTPAAVPSATQTPFVIVVTATLPAPTRAAPSATAMPASATPAASPTAAAQVTAAAPVTVQGLLFGPFHLPETNYPRGPFTGAFVSLKPDTAIPTLEAARAAGIRLVVNLAGGRRGYQEADGAFSVAKFTERLDAFQGVDLAPYVADGTLMGHMMFDEPTDPSNWNGARVPYADIEAAAAYSKKLWPMLPVGVGGEPSFLLEGAPWSALDFGYAQYTTKHGSVSTWVRSEVEAARKARLGLLFGINILGGNARQAVTAAQLREWATLLISEPAVCGVLMWKYDQAYLQDPNIAAAMAEISEAARHKTSPACRPEGS